MFEKEEIIHASVPDSTPSHTSVCFKSSDPSNIVKRIEINKSGSDLDTYSLTLFTEEHLHSDDFSVSDIFNQFMEDNEYFQIVREVPTSSDLSIIRYSFQTTDLSLMGDFINKISSVIPVLSGIKQELGDYFDCDLSQTYELPTWLSVIDNSSSQLFYNSDLSSIFKKVYLKKNENNDFNFDLTMRDAEKFSLLCNFIDEHSSANEQIIRAPETNSIRLMTQNKFILKIFIELITTNFTELEAISEALFELIGPLIDFFNIPLDGNDIVIFSGDADSLPPAIFNLFHMLQSSMNPSSLETLDLNEILNLSFQHSQNEPELLPDPGPGKNEARLEAIGYSNANVEERFKCAISAFTMSKPVYDPKLPDVHFDKPQILRWLSTNSTNPFNRQPLQATELVKNSELKNEIEGFIKCEEEKHLSNKPKTG